MEALETRDLYDRSRLVSKREVIHEGYIIDMVGETVELEPGVSVYREYVEHPGAVGVVALREGQRGPEILLLRQYRHPVRSLLWEIPAGLLDVEAEDYQRAAARELYEEADLRASRWDVLVDLFTSPGGSNESLRIYLARDVSEVPAEHRFTRSEEEASMPVSWVELKKAAQLVFSGHIHNPTAVVGILAAQNAATNGFEGLRKPSSHWMR